MLPQSFVTGLFAADSMFGVNQVSDDILQNASMIKVSQFHLHVSG